MPDTRNWEAASFEPQSWQAVRWIDLDNVEAPDDDLRKRGAAAGATLFARGEGMWMGEGELYFACTSGGAAKLGQVFRLRPQPSGEDRLQLFFESTDIAQFNYGDNLTVAPNGHLIVCEDAYSDTVANRLIGLTPAGAPYPLALLRAQTEWAGACFSPDGKWLFVNAYKPTRTLAITGPW
jgi:secreted PhoX family phosphatase